MKTSTRIIAITAAALALGTGGLAYARHGQGDMGCMGAGMGPGMDTGMHKGGPGGMHAAPNAAGLASHLAAVKSEIGITAAQEPAWQTFESVARQHAEARQAMHSAMHGPDASAKHEAQHDAMLKQREAHGAESDAARQALYAVLTPEQKAIADQRLAAGRGHRMAMHRH